VAHKISFIVAARDESIPVLHSTIDGLLDTSAGHDREIVLVDDGSLVPIAQDRRQLVVLRHAAPVGVAQSRRHGASAASGDILVWLDAHMSFAPDWLGHMLAHVDSGALLCAAWWDYELTRPQCWGADFVWCGERDYYARRTPGFGFKHRTRPPSASVVEVPMAIGACYMMLRRSYERFGGMSPFFRIWGNDEQDISTRAWITGLGVKCVTDAHVGHLTRSSFPYPVSWEDIEFNQVAMARTIFEEPVAARIEELLQPLPLCVEMWLRRTDFREWRRLVQSERRIRDAEFFRRFLPDGPPCPMPG
jgi:glycosyltransferase involved in cell wall biosynthesis